MGFGRLRQLVNHSGCLGDKTRDPWFCSYGDRARCYETDHQLIHPRSIRELGRLRNLIAHRHRNQPLRLKACLHTKSSQIFRRDLDRMAGRYATAGELAHPRAIGSLLPVIKTRNGEGTDPRQRC